MKRINVTDKSTLQEVIAQGGDDDVVIERDGHAIALIVPFDDEDREWYARERDPAFIHSIARAREQIKSGQAIGHEELKARLGLKK